MNSFEASLFDMGINLGGGDAGVAQHHLDGSEVGSVFQEVCCKGMPEHMGGDPLGDASPWGSRSQHLPKSLPGKRPS